MIRLSPFFAGLASSLVVAGVVIMSLAVMGLAGFVSPQASAADLAQRHAPRLPPFRPQADYPPEEYDQERVHIYTRPVVGFYAYPNDYQIPEHRPTYRNQTNRDPYILRRDAPHGIAFD